MKSSLSDSTTNRQSRWHGRLGIAPMALIVLFMTCLMTLVGTAAHGKGGDTVAPFPFMDTRGGKQEAVGMAVDSSGNVVVVGYTNTGVNGNDWQIVKIKADGSGLSWSPVTFGGAGDDVATAVAIDSADNIIVTGYTWNGTNYDVHTMKLNGADGTELWHHTYGSAGGVNDYSSAITVDGSNNIYVAGYAVNGAQKDDILILKYASTGPVADAPQWVELYDDAAYPNNNNRAVSIAAGSGGIAITGYSSKAGTDFDILTRKYGFDKTLIREWRYSSTGTRDDRGVAVRLDSADVIVTGYFTNASNNTGIYTVKYDPSSDTPVWEKTYDNGTGNDKPTALWVDGAGDVYVAGFTSTLVGNEDFCVLRYGSADGNGGWQMFYDAGNSSTDIPAGIVVDNGADGGVFVTGYTTAAGNENFQTMKLRKDNGTILWQQGWNGSGNKGDRPIGIGLDPSRNVIVAGWSDGTDYDIVALKYDFGPLNAPTGLTAAAASDTSINLTWEDNSANEEQFVIQRKLGEGGTFADISTTPAVLPAGTVTYTDTGLTANNYYYYRVRAKNAANGDSAYSNEARALTKVIAYEAPAWSYSYDGGTGEDVATGVAVGTDDHPVITGYSLVADVGGNSFDYVTVKLNRGDKSQIWKSTYDSGDGGTDMAAGVAIDTKDNRNDVIVTGTAYVFGGGAENSDDLFTLKYLAANGNPSADPGWPKRYGTGDWVDNAVAVVTAADGSSAVIGYGMNGATGVGNNDIYVIKYNVDGTQAWTPYVYDSGRDDYPTAVAFDGSGNIVVTGYTRNASGNDDWFTAKIKGSDGTLVWSDADQMDGEGHGHDRAMSVAVDAGGDVYVTGYVVNGAGNEDMVTVKYKGTPAAPPVAERVWTSIYDGPANGNDRGIAVRIDPIDGAVVVAGTRYTTATDSDFFIVRYNQAGGSTVWERNFDRPLTYDYVTAMTLDSSGYIYVAGNSRGGVDTNPDFDASSDVLSIIYDYEGTFLGALTYNGTDGNQDEATSLAVNYQGEAFIAGFTRNAAGIAHYLMLKHKNNYILVPAPLTATPQADYSKVDLTWRQNTPGTSFRIERTLAPSNPGSVWTTVATPGSGTLAYTDTGRSAGTGYCYRIDAYSGSLNSRKIEKCMTTTLPAPVLSPLTVDSTSQISLAWSQITGNTGYKVERKTGAGGVWGVLTTKGVDQNSHVDTGLAAGTTYYYRISTSSAAGYSVASNEVSAITKPAAPTINAPTGITKNQMTVSWSGVTGAASYSLEYKESGGVYAPFASCTAIGGTSCTVTGLTTDKTYFFHVKAANASGSSDWSGETNGRTLLPEPTLSTATGMSKTQIDLSWTAVAQATGYAVQQSNCWANNDNPGVCNGTDSYYGGWSQIGTTVAGTTTYSVTTGLASGGNYRFRIVATVAGNTSAASNVLHTWTWLTPPATFTILPKTSTALTVSWSDATGETSYTIERRPPAGTWAEIKTGQGFNTTSYDNTGLLESTQYCYRMRPVNAGVVGQPVAETYTAEVCKFTPLNAPTLNTASNVTTTSATLTWNNIAGNNGYEIQRSIHNDPNNPGTNNWGAYTTITSPKLGTDVVTYDNTALTPGSTYKYQVRDTFGTGEYSSWSNEVAVTLIPPAPVLNNPTGSGTDAASLTWNNTYGETSFKVERKADAGGTWAQIGTSAQNTPSYSDSGLSAGIVYYYRVRAANGSGNSEYSNEKTVLPGPTLNALFGITASKIELSWNNIAGNSGYKIERKTGAGGTWSQVATVGANVTTYPNSGLSAGTLYYYRVSATNASGGSLLSNEQSASTTPATPTATATVASASQVDLSWQVMYGATEYHVEQKIGAGGSWTSIGTVVKAYSQSYCGYPVPRIGCTSLISDSASLSATGLTENTTYCYQVMAWNSTGGNSVPSAERCVTTSAMASQSLTATALNSFKIKLEWSPIACAPNPCDDPDGYQVEKQAWNNEWALLKTVPAGTTTFTDTVGNEPLKTRKYRVRTYKGADFSPYSNIATVTPPAYQADFGTCP